MRARWVDVNGKFGEQHMFSAELQWNVSHLSLILSSQPCSYFSYNDDGLDMRTKQ